VQVSLVAKIHFEAGFAACLSKAGINAFKGVPIICYNKQMKYEISDFDLFSPYVET